MRTPFLISIAAAFATGCGGALISNQQEQEIGHAVNGQIETEYKLVSAGDPVFDWAQEFIQPFVPASKQFRPPDEFGGYKIAVIADDELVNAFAAPGGFTYLTTGLLLTADNCAEIAGVMGHELAHVTQRHGAKSMEKSFAAQQLADFFLGEGISGTAAKTIWGFLQATRFSQADETESDSVGLRISHDAGYNPYGLADFFSKLLAVEKANGGSPPQFLSSHPATDSRVKAVSAEIKRRYGDSVKPTDAKRDACQKTKMTLAQVKAHIKSGSMKVDAKQPATAAAPAAASAPESKAVSAPAKKKKAGSPPQPGGH